MNKIVISLLITSVLTIGSFFANGEADYATAIAPHHQLPLPSPVDSLKVAAFQILEAKCNVCHRKRNPFMIFKEKNMARRASKIYQQVFVKRRMPKPEGEPLTEEEYAALKAWLTTPPPKAAR
ncbi:MAG: hypothetical protein AAF840_08205 [Bacteroidota bacterium]